MKIFSALLVFVFCLNFTVRADWKDFDYTWDTTSQTDGAKNILAAAYDDVGNRTESTLPVTVDNAQAAWWAAKDSQAPVVALPAEFGTPYPQPLANMGWEDGLFLTRDGLNLYCSYIPADYLSFTINADTLDHYYLYQRGSVMGMDLVTNPAGSFPWFHVDILYAHRNSASEPFTSFQLSNMARSVYAEGGFCAVQANSALLDIAVFTSNDNSSFKTDIRYFMNVPNNPTGLGTSLSAVVNTDDTEDNPHIERLDANNLVVFFDSNDRPGNVGMLDIWYTTSPDNGTTWTAPVNVSSVNTVNDEHQPHLYKDKTGQWFLYYSATHTDGKLAIFRARQLTPGNWNSWGPKELVVSAGTTLGVGEPTLTENGDISFLVVFKKTGGTAYDQYDADPWFLPKK
jgi:hypothetical protein